MKKTRIFKVCLLAVLVGVLSTNKVSANVGINVEDPKSELDIYGSTQIEGPLYIGGEGANKGNAGALRQVLVSRGEGLSPEWKTFLIPDLDPGSYDLTQKIYKISTKPAAIAIPVKPSGEEGSGKITISTPDLGTVYNEADGWVTVSDIGDITVKKEDNKLSFTVSLGVKTLQDNKEIGCAVFDGGNLIAYRSAQLDTGDKSLTIISSAERIAIGTHLMKVACIGTQAGMVVGDGTSSYTGTMEASVQLLEAVDVQ